MNFSITGHTSGLGKALEKWCLQKQENTVIGFSRTTGYNLNDPKCIPLIIELAKDYDVFINNAYAKMAQVDLLYALYDVWSNDASKTIINISSNTGDVVKNFRHHYAVCKLALDHAVAQLQNTSHSCRIMNIRPGYIDTPMVSHVVAKKMNADYVANIVGWMIEQPCLIKSLTLTS